MLPGDLCAIIDDLPGQLAAWHAGPDALPVMLQALAARRTDRFAREGRHPALVAPDHLRLDTDSQDQFRHAAMSIVRWSTDHNRSTRTKVPPDHPARGGTRGTKQKRGRRFVPSDVSVRDFNAAVDLAMDWQALDIARTGLRSGDITIHEAGGRHMWLTNHRNAAIEALDMTLAKVTIFDPPADGPAFEETKAWFAANHGSPDRVNQIPALLRRSVWNDALGLLEAQNTTIPEGTDLGGLTLAEARVCYAGLITQLYFNDISTVGLESQDAMLWGIRQEMLVAMLCQRVEETTARAFIELVRYAPGRSPVSAPLIPHRHLLLIPSDLVSPIGFERTLLRASGADPSRSGQLGNVLGKRATRWAERLESIPGCRVAQRVKVKDHTGKTLGDLDVVAWDPDRQLAVVFETKWTLDAATLTESYKVESELGKGRRQTARLREQMQADDVKIKWPRDWDVPNDTEFRWWVASAQQLDSTTAANSDDIGSTSLRLVEHLLPQSDLEAFLNALVNVHLPEQGVDFDLVEQRVDAGPFVLHYNAIALADTPPPPPHLRTNAGWT